MQGRSEPRRGILETAGQPPYLYPDYESTRLRAPDRPLIILPKTLEDPSGPAYGRDRLGEFDHDLTRQHSGEPLGERIVVTGRVTDGDGRPVRGSLVEIWQANAAGRYIMLGISTVLMPALTNGLNQLPRRLYSHGTAIANTAQQVGAAFGTALLVAVLSYGTQAYITDSGAGGQLGAVNFGTTLAFATSATVAAIGLVLCLFMRHATPEDEDEPVPETA